MVRVPGPGFTSSSTDYRAIVLPIPGLFFPVTEGAGLGLVLLIRVGRKAIYRGGVAGFPSLLFPFDYYDFLFSPPKSDIFEHIPFGNPDFFGQC